MDFGNYRINLIIEKKILSPPRSSANICEPSSIQHIVYIFIFSHLISAQTTCNQGIGRVVYERLPDHQIQGYDDEIVSDDSFDILQKFSNHSYRKR